MTAETDPLIESAERLFTQHATKPVRQSAEAGTFPHTLWTAVTEAGYPAALLPEHAGGFGLSTAEAMRLLQVCAAHAAPIPLAETMLAGWLLAQAGLPIPEGVLTVAPVRRDTALTLTATPNGWHLQGTATRIPWARDAAALVALVLTPNGPMLAAVPAPKPSHLGKNLAGEPRDTVIFDHALPAASAAPSPITPAQLRAAGAVLRTVQIAGALARTLALCVDYAQTRIAFGRPIGKFQAIQQNLAILAGQSAAALAAADTASEALGNGLPVLPIAAAKSRAGEAASIAAGLAHQAHGAIGFTQEYALQPLTRRLWSWRDEFGNEAEWNALVGRAALAAGPEGLWPLLTASPLPKAA